MSNEEHHENKNDTHTFESDYLQDATRSNCMIFGNWSSELAGYSTGLKLISSLEARLDMSR
jgi:hypothetical protein